MMNELLLRRLLVFILLNIFWFALDLWTLSILFDRNLFTLSDSLLLLFGVCSIWSTFAILFFYCYIFLALYRSLISFQILIFLFLSTTLSFAIVQEIIQLFFHLPCTNLRITFPSFLNNFPIRLNLSLDTSTR